MNRSKVRKAMQDRVDRGDFADRDAVIAFGLSRGWTLYRNSASSLTFGWDQLSTSRQRFRVRLPFDDAEEVAVQAREAFLRDRLDDPYSKGRLFAREPYSLPDCQLRFVYILVSFDGDDSAAYIGHSATTAKRLNGHINRKLTTRSSGLLRSWAAERGVPIRFIVVDAVLDDVDKPEATRRATHLEGLWTHRASLAGVELPGVEGWGQFPPQNDEDDAVALWTKAVGASVPVDKIFSQTLDFGEVCLPTIDLPSIRARFEASARNRTRIELASISDDPPCPHA